MPELPEVETVRLQLEKYVAGHAIESVVVRNRGVFWGEAKTIIGAKITGAKRFGKMLVLELSNGEFIAIHLKMTGRLIYQKLNIKNQKYYGWELDYTTDRHTHVVFNLSGGSKLYYWDVRRFGWIKLMSKANLNNQIAKLGIEPFTNNYTLENFKKALGRTKKAIKMVLMDQAKISGVGNIYANEALFLAHIDPRRSAASLTSRGIVRLFGTIRKALEDGLKYRGASENDFRDLLGGKGELQNHFRVYARAGKKCPNNCGGVIYKEMLGGRGTFFCKQCQK